MREYQVSKLIGNEILAKPVRLENGNIILEIGTILKPDYIEALISLNIHKIFIEDPFEKYEKENMYFDKKVVWRFEDDLRNILSQHIYKDNQGLKKLIGLAERIVTVFEETKEKRALDVVNRTADLYEHTIYTTILVMILGKEYGFPRKRMVDAVLGCLLHDLGYQYINVIYKNCCYEKMTPIEIYELKRHTILGYSALNKESWIPEISKLMILLHHEKLDGSGYPLKQRASQEECRMIQICDAFDCTVSGMECMKKTLLQAFEIISDCKAYDFHMREILVQKIGYYPVGTFVKTENQKLAVVISQTENAKAPIILYMNGIDNSHIVTENLNRKEAPRILSPYDSLETFISVKD